ncbi:hypothetical protein [Nocardia sp. NPDC051750]|uniref:hypothetical protein n=1 Tax=Nocardia sp. NPDC051750 TaxID=3364325 RepID=UPI0037B61576
MSRVFSLDSDELAGQSPTISGAAEELAAALHNLETALGTEGQCWGNDEPGKAFEQTYDPDAKQTVANLRNLVGTLRSSGRSLKDIGDRFNSIDTDAGYRVREHESQSETAAFTPAGSPGSDYPASRPGTGSPLSGADSQSPDGMAPDSESWVGGEQGQRGSRPPAADDTAGNGPGSGAGVPSGPSGEPPQSPSARDSSSTAGATEAGAGLGTGDPPPGAAVAPTAQMMPSASLGNATAGAETAGPASSPPWARPAEPTGPGGQSPGSQAGQPSGSAPGARSPAQPPVSGAKQQRRERKKDNKQQERRPEVAASDNADRPPAVPAPPVDPTRLSGGSRKHTTPWSKPEPAEPAETPRADGPRIGH